MTNKSPSHLKTYKIFYFSIAVLFTLLKPTSAEIPDDPKHCKYKCTDNTRMCALKKSKCKYTNATIYDCKGSYDCPVEYNCDRNTNFCVYAPLDPTAAMFCWCCCFYIFCISCPIGCYQLY